MRKLKIAWMALLFFLISASTQARIIRNGDIASPFKSSKFDEIVELINREDEYRWLSFLWKQKKGWDSMIERVSFLVEVLNHIEKSMIFDEKSFRNNYPNIREDIEQATARIEEAQEERDEIISNLLWERLDRKEKRIFIVAATKVPGYNHKKLLFQYIKDVNSCFIFHFITHPHDHSVIRNFITSEFKNIGIPSVNYIRDWIPEFSKKMEEFINVEKVEPDDAWGTYINFIKKLPEFLHLLEDRGLYTYTLARKIFTISLELAGDSEEIENNFLSIEKLIQKLPKDRTGPSLLHDILDISFGLSKGISENYQNNNEAIANLIETLNNVDEFSSKSVRSLLNAAKKFPKIRAGVFIDNLDEISEFIEFVEAYKEFLTKDGEEIKLEDVLWKEIPELSEEAGSNYLLFRRMLSDLGIKLTKDVRERFDGVVTEKNIRDAVVSIYKENLAPTQTKVAEILNIPDELLNHFAQIKEINLEELINSSYFEQIENSNRPLNPQDIQFFKTHFVVNGLTLEEIINRFFALDEDGQIIYKKTETLNSFVYSPEFKAEGNLVLFPEEFINFVDDIYLAYIWVRTSPQVIKEFDKYGIKPERVGKNGEIIAIARYRFHTIGNKKLEIVHPSEFQRRKILEGHMVPLILGNLFTSGTKWIDGESGLCCYRVIDNKGNMIAEFNKNDRSEIIAVYFRSEKDKCWRRWSVSKNKFDKDIYSDYFSSWAKFLNDIVRNNPFIYRDEDVE